MYLCRARTSLSTQKKREQQQLQQLPHRDVHCTSILDAFSLKHGHWSHCVLQHFFLFQVPFKYPCNFLLVTHTVSPIFQQTKLWAENTKKKNQSFAWFDLRFVDKYIYNKISNNIAKWFSFKSRM